MKRYGDGSWQMLPRRVNPTEGGRSLKFEVGSLKW